LDRANVPFTQLFPETSTPPPSLAIFPISSIIPFHVINCMQNCQ
jgi:hypothetical protein